MPTHQFRASAAAANELDYTTSGLSDDADEVYRSTQQMAHMTNMKLSFCTHARLALLHVVPRRWVQVR